MDQRRLKHFVTLAETLHFGEAAARLGMTQPPLSQSIQSLEQELGAPLFHRTNRRVRLSLLGEQWLPAVQSALSGVEALPELARQILRGETGRLAVSFVSTADYSILPAVVSRFRRQYPEVELQLTEATSDVQLRQLMEGRGDLGLVIRHEQSVLPAALAYQKLVVEPLIAAVPEVWLKEGRIDPKAGRLSPRTMSSLPLIVFPRHVADSFYDLVVGYYERYCSDLNIAQHAIQMQTIIGLVSAGMGMALVPASMQNLARPGVVYLRLSEKAPQIESGILWRAEEATPAVHNFIRIAVAQSVRLGQKTSLPL